MNASFSKVLRTIAQRPSVVVVVLGLAGFLVDFLVRPISTAGLVLLLLAASPFLLRMVRSDQRVSGIPTAAATSQPPRAPAPAAGQAPQQAKPRVARPAELERASPEPRRVDARPEQPAPSRPLNRVPRFEEPARTERQRTSAE